MDRGHAVRVDRRRYLDQNEVILASMRRTLVAILALAAPLACGAKESTGAAQTPGAKDPLGGGPAGPAGSSGGGAGVVDENSLLPTDSVWQRTSEWYRPIDGAPVAEHSAQMVGALAKWGTTGVFQIDFSFSVLDGQGAAHVKFPLQEEADDVAVPIPAKGYVEGDYAYDACPSGEDCHILVVDRPAKKLFEVYQAKRSGSAWSGYVAFWQLDKTYPRDNRGQGCTSAEAAGLAITPGLIGYRETKNGRIEHALRFIIRNEYIRGLEGDKTVPNVVYPASHGSTAGNAAGGIPYGGRLRLKAAFKEDDPRVKTPGAKAIVRALHRYGMILADGGNLPLTAESVRMHADADAKETWEGILAPRDLGFIQPSDFEVVAIPKDHPGGAEGWYASRADYEAQLKRPLGCVAIRQP